MFFLGELELKVGNKRLERDIESERDKAGIMGVIA